MEESIAARIGRYLSGEMTEHEKGIFEQELASDPILHDEYLSLKRVWAFSSAKMDANWDTDAAWKRFSKDSGVSGTQVVRSLYSRLFWPAAAILLILIGAFGFFLNQGQPVTYTYQEESTEPIELKDGSKIYLNHSSTAMVFPFSKKKRDVELKGEAFFEIAPDATRPFVVQAGGTRTEVTGTSFNIQQSGDITHIFVNSGKVIFSSLEDQKLALALTVGEAASFENNKMQMIANPSLNINAWRTRQLQFGNMSLAAIVADVADYFNQQIIIENETVKSCRINIMQPFKNPEIKSVLNAVAASINAKVVKEGDKYIIRGQGCF